MFITVIDLLEINGQMCCGDGVSVGGPASKAIMLI